MGQLETRIIKEKDEVQKVVDFQYKIWGEKNVTPYPYLIASIHNGGLIIGSFLHEELVAFCYAFPGYKNGESYLVSHMMAVSTALRNNGIGFQLKNIQKEWALKQGYNKIVWTFDPLESRNAYLNICKIGGYVKTYLPDHYGSMEDEMNKGMPSDRFLLEWDLKNQRKKEHVPENVDSLIQLHKNSVIPMKVKDEIVWDANYYKVPVPSDIHIIKKEDFSVALKWRTLLAYCFQKLFKNGYMVVDFHKSEKLVNYYIVKKREDHHEREDN